MIRPKISDNSRLLMLSVLVGLCSGTAAVVLLKLIKLFQNLTERLTSCGPFNFLYVLLPAVGMLLSLLIVKYLIKDNIGHGVTRVLKAVSTGESRIKMHNCWSSLITSSLTIGFGGSVGAEAPIVYTGAAIGSNMGRIFGLNMRSVRILVGCGAAGAVAGIFKAPLAGVLFTLEILMFNISVTSMMPLLLSTVSASVVSYLFAADVHPFLCSLSPFKLGNIPFYIILGVFCGFVSRYFQSTTLWLEDRLSKFKNPYLKWLCCGLGLGVIVLIFPPLFGEGYSSLSPLLMGGEIDFGESPLSFLLNTPWGIPLFFALVLCMKVIAMTFTNSGGGVGGTFGPTLFVGAISGFLLSRIFNLSFAGSALSLPEQNFVLVGMAGTMAGVMKAPMTAIFLIAEISGGYELFLPLIITSSVSFLITRIWERYSIYTKRLAQAGELLTHDSDQAIMILMRTADLVRDKYPRVSKDASLRELVDIISDSTAAVIAVVDANGRFEGVIDIGNVRKYMFRSEEYDTLKVSDLMEAAPAFVYVDEKMESVMRKFDRTEAWRLPVIDDDSVYRGFVSRSRILSAYRDKLKEMSED